VTAARPAAPLPEFAPEPAAFEPPPRHVFAEIVARPLFSASRRPFAAESEAAGEPSPGKSIAIELVGTLLTKRGAAALLLPQGQNARWLRAGETIAGWQVETIQRDQVSLHLDGEAKTLELRADLVQPAQPPKKAELGPAQGNAQPREQAQAQEMRAPDQAKGGDAQRVLAELKRRLEAATEPRTN
jgi:hypothetical protein